jgi:hypothetical protein
MLSCITTAMTDPKSPTAYQVTIYTTNLLPVTCKTSQCSFVYDDGLTPFIYEIYPSTAVGNQLMKVYGKHRISDIGDGRSPTSNLKYILIGDSSCSTLDIIQDTISPLGA